MRTVRLYKHMQKVSAPISVDGLDRGVYEIEDSDLLLVVETGGWWVANSLGFSPDLNCRVEVLGIWNGSHPVGMT
jgi:hypothetical protein